MPVCCIKGHDMGRGSRPPGCILDNKGSSYCCCKTLPLAEGSSSGAGSAPLGVGVGRGLPEEAEEELTVRSTVN